MRRLVAIFGLMLSAATVAAQETPVPVSPVLTIDQERLFSETRPGLRSARAIEGEAEALAEENRRIEEELRAEELDLTARRSELSAEEFTTLADAFDQKVQRIRAEQDAKARRIAEMQEEARQSFLIEVGGILSDLVRERGAVVILDRRDVFLSADIIDITDEAIARINETTAGDTDAAEDGAGDGVPADEQ
jgi:Skp family chaperone for outer membrane proteins